MKWINIWRHFRTITEHKILVMKNCFRVGLYRQGLFHDMSKYSPEEFWTGRNKHHFEYWIDFSMDKSKGLVGNKMPVNYVAEMMMDRIAASSVYKGKDYTNSSPMEYYNREKDFIVIHPETRALLVHLLTVLSEQGEEALFAEIRVLLKKGDY